MRREPTSLQEVSAYQQVRARFPEPAQVEIRPGLHLKMICATSYFLP